MRPSRPIKHHIVAEAEHRFGQFPCAVISFCRKPKWSLSRRRPPPAVRASSPWSWAAVAPAQASDLPSKRSRGCQARRGRPRAARRADKKRRGRKSDDGAAASFLIHRVPAPRLARNFSGERSRQPEPLWRRAGRRFSWGFIVERPPDLPTHPPAERDPPALCLAPPPSWLREIQWASAGREKHVLRASTRLHQAEVRR